MTQEDRNWWEQMRTRGRRSFILREGILHHGTGAAFALVVLQVAFIIFFTRDSVPLISLALAWLALSIILGSLIGNVLWKQHEKDYRNDSQ
ncbi:MAG TPA: hypothetical protein VH280_09150 [Verrucomicrobiae bacterium]|jgi:hypothetical protein|nr:hypothetical protein [Verrucomicrobiae bacterium]